MAKLTNVQRAFLTGVKYGYRLAADETRCDIEDLMEQLKEANEEVRAELDAVRSERVRRQTIGEAGETERDPDTTLN